ncbi:MAG: peptidase M16 [Deltaproteobacteria bacterium]|nr:MAG: peptidase M16 [Deltaproteobacteria bacterium]
MGEVNTQGDIAGFSDELAGAGYRLLRRESIELIDATFYLFEHRKTGARHVHIDRDDAEHVFSVAFKTVPADGTGVAHILEHTVLCGSEKYPVRDPFFSMLKRSLNTFMNAFTAPDWTLYPFATQNLKDYENLMGVYLDAVFNPVLSELSFKQEGHRVEFDEAGRLTYKGVVYNEMKGVMSSPNQVMIRSLLNALFPDTTYRFNSGGDPAEIPSLTHADLVAFHKRHYHPSNAFFFTYGNQPVIPLLTRIDREYLAAYARLDPKTRVDMQPRWHQPRTCTYKYPVSPEADLEKKSQIALAWLTGDIQDAFHALSFTLLSQILLGNAASPLRKALIESGIGTALSDGTGFDADNRDTLFACGLKNVNETDVPAVESLILDTLASIAEKGIDKAVIDAAIHQLEFHRKEVSNSPYPYGLKLLFTFCSTWFHDGDPVKVLRMDEDLERIRESVAAGGFFESLIRSHLLDNPHRVTFLLKPDPDQQARTAEVASAALQAMAAGLDERQRQKIIDDAAALKSLQESPEDLSCLPSLGLEDVSTDIWTLSASDAWPDIPAACYPQPTSGIQYYMMVMGAGALPDHLLVWVPFFCAAFSRMGTSKKDYAQMSRELDAVTGSLGMAPQIRTRLDETPVALMVLRMKCLDRNQEKALALATELLTDVCFDDHARLKTLLLEYRTGIETSIVENGHRYAMMLAARSFSAAAGLSERWSGIHQLQMIRTATDDLTDEKLNAIAGHLREIASRVICQDNIRLQVTAEPDALGTLQKKNRLADLLNALLPSGMHGFDAPPLETAFDGSVREGWQTQSSVAFVASVLPVVTLTHPDAPALKVLERVLKNVYLHREIREKGGAYGIFSAYSQESGLFSLCSYRDPQIAPTLQVYADACAYLLAHPPAEVDLIEAVLQVFSEIDRPETPSVATRKAFMRAFMAHDDDMRRAFKKRLLALTPADVMNTARRYFQAPSREPGISVIAGEALLSDANRQMKDAPLTLRQI